MTRGAGLTHRYQGRLAVGIHLPSVVLVGRCPRTVGSIRSGYQSFVRGRIAGTFVLLGVEPISGVHSEDWEFRLHAVGCRSVVWCRRGSAWSLR